MWICPEWQEKLSSSVRYNPNASANWLSFAEAIAVHTIGKSDPKVLGTCITVALYAAIPLCVTVYLAACSIASI